MIAFTNKYGSPKTHKKRTCSICRESLNSRCILPFRHIVPVRKYQAFIGKPTFRYIRKKVNE